MKTFLLFTLAGVVALFSIVWSKNYLQTHTTGAPPYDASTTNNVRNNDVRDLIRDWVRPDGPAKVALQVGHWKNDELPEELEKLKGNTGASGGGKTEWEVNYEIAIQTKALLEKEGIRVELLPTAIPKHYWADAFIAIHADGSLNMEKRGFKIAGPWRDMSGSGDTLISLLETSYEEATKFEKDENITRNMRGYYAFSWWRYEHAVHPMTPSAIVETGFLSSAEDRTIIVDQPEIAAQGIAKGIIQYLKTQNLL